ncbi:MAG TPA: hypothetical protein VFW05_03140 [Verrucomicrobiae bacterium]|nr:hypothetical protein [Verrucomicrobiae bacterium]
MPNAWPSGKVTGLRARGGFTVDRTLNGRTDKSQSIVSNPWCRVR